MIRKVLVYFFRYLKLGLGSLLHKAIPYSRKKIVCRNGIQEIQ